MEEVEGKVEGEVGEDQVTGGNQQHANSSKPWAPGRALQVAAGVKIHAEPSWRCSSGMETRVRKGCCGIQYPMSKKRKRTRKKCRKGEAQFSFPISRKSRPGFRSTGSPVSIHEHERRNSRSSEASRLAAAHPHHSADPSPCVWLLSCLQ